MKLLVEQAISHEFAFDNKALKTFDESGMCWKHSKFECRQMRMRTSSHPDLFYTFHAHCKSFTDVSRCTATTFWEYFLFNYDMHNFGFHIFAYQFRDASSVNVIVTGVFTTRMWANAQRDGRPAEHRWRPLFNAAEFGWRPLLDWRAVTLPRRESRWN